MNQYWAVQDWDGTIHVGRCKEEAFKNAKEGMNVQDWKNIDCGIDGCPKLKRITEKCYKHFSNLDDNGFYDTILNWIVDVNEKEEIEDFLLKKWGLEGGNVVWEHIKKPDMPFASISYNGTLHAGGYLNDILEIMEKENKILRQAIGERV